MVVAVTNTTVSSTSLCRSLCSGRLDDEGKIVLEVLHDYSSDVNDDLANPVKNNIECHHNNHWDEESIHSTCKLWQLTENEIMTLRTLGKRLYDINHIKNNPTDVLRFLRARSWDINASEIMFRNMIQWRQNNNVDIILKEYTPPNEIIKYYPGAIIQGRDRDNDPIFVSRIGSTDNAGILRKYGHDEMIQHAIWLRENVGKGSWMKRYEQEQHRPMKQMTIIEDLHNIPILQIIRNRKLLSIYGEIMRLDQDNYPESAKRIIIIRAPTLFHMIWKIVKIFFDTGVVDKMVFCGEYNYQHILEKYIDLEVLPHELVPDIGQGQAEKGQSPNFHGGLLPL